MTPTARTLLELRKRGWLAQVVEQTIPHTFIKRDLFGCIDIIALDGQPGVLGIQVTSSSNVAARVTKMRTQCADAVERWLGAGNRLVVHGWSKQGKRHARKVWAMREIEVS